MNTKLIKEIIDSYGGTSAAARHFGYKGYMGVQVWKKQGIPHKFHAQIAEEKGITPRRLKNCRPKKQVVQG